MCAVLDASPGAAPATTTSATQILRPVRGNAFTHAAALHVSRAGVVVRVDVCDAAERLCVRMTQTVAVRAGAPG